MVRKSTNPKKVGVHSSNKDDFVPRPASLATVVRQKLNFLGKKFIPERRVTFKVKHG
jgi:hypothetical protein